MIINDVQFNCALEDVLTELVSQLRANNIPLISKQRNSGEHIQITCPYHSNGMERKPSAGIRKSDGVFHCFACGEIHTLPEVISHCFGHDEDLIGTWGWQWLLKNFAIVQVEERKDVEIDFRRSNMADKNSIKADKINNNRVTEEELDKYRYIHPYMYKRGLTDEIIELFDIGVDLQSKCITFPNLDKNGNCLFVARRGINSKWFNYPANIQKPLYGLYQLYQLHPFPSEVYVCESMIDCCLLWKNKKPACALNGLGNEIQFKQLRELPCRVLILATDSDEAGLRARERIRVNMQNTKIIKEVVLPKGRKDIGECTDSEIQNLIEIF